MKTTLFSTISMICLALLMSNALAQPAAAQPETETITFGVLFDYTGPSGVSLDAIGENTIGIFTGMRFPETVGGSLVFGGSSPDCELAGTTWGTVGSATIINQGGPLWGGTIYTNSFSPPERYMLLDCDIIEVNACFLQRSGGFAYPQADSSDATDVFFIVTAEFRVNN